MIVSSRGAAVGSTPAWSSLAKWSKSVSVVVIGSMPYKAFSERKTSRLDRRNPSQHFPSPFATSTQPLTPTRNRSPTLDHDQHDLTQRPDTTGPTLPHDPSTTTPPPNTHTHTLAGSASGT